MACVGDLVIDPEHRDKGLFKQIMDFMLDDLANQGYTFVFNLSAGTLTQLGALAMGWRSIGVLDVRQRIGYVYRVLRRVRYHLRIEETKPFDRIDRKLGKTFTRNGRSISLEQKPRPEQMASLVANLKRKNRLAHEKSIKFFRWRFDNPIVNYRFLFSGDLEGYLVLQTNRTYDPCLVQIVDWEADEFPILEELLNTAVDLCKFMRLSITLPRFDPQMSDLLEQLRFTKDPFGTRIEDYRPMILLRSVSNEMLRDEWTVNGLDLVDADNWDMRPIYSDGF